MSVDRARRHPRHSFSGLDASCHNGAGPDDGAVSNTNAFENNCVRAYPDVAPNHDGRFYKSLIGDWPSPLKSVIMIRYITERPYQALRPDLDPFRCVEHRRAIHIGATANCQPRQRGSLTCRQEHNALIQRHVVGKLDVPRVSRDIHLSDPALLSDPRAKQPQTRDPKAHRERTGISDRAVDQFVTQIRHSQGAMKRCRLWAQRRESSG